MKSLKGSPTSMGGTLQGKGLRRPDSVRTFGWESFWVVQGGRGGQGMGGALPTSLPPPTPAPAPGTMRSRLQRFLHKLQNAQHWKLRVEFSQSLQGECGLALGPVKLILDFRSLKP